MLPANPDRFRLCTVLLPRTWGSGHAACLPTPHTASPLGWCPGTGPAHDLAGHIWQLSAAQSGPLQRADPTHTGSLTSEVVAWSEPCS